MKIDKLIKREIIISIITVIAITIAFFALSYAVYMTIGKGQTNAVEYGEFSIELCTDATCPDIASNLENVIGTTVSNDVLVQTQLYPMSDEEALEATPYTFVVRNNGDWDGYVDMDMSAKFSFENGGSNMITDFSNIKYAYKRSTDVNPTINNLNTEDISEILYDKEKIEVGTYKIYNFWIWGNENISNDVIEKYLISKISVRGYYLPNDPNNLHSRVRETPHLYMDFYYTGAEQTYPVPVSGTYKLEVWGASGGNANETYQGGYGGYSAGEIYIDKTQTPNLYVNVGGTGSVINGVDVVNGGYNGGGSGYNAGNAAYYSGGGGATHIATSSGLLSSFYNANATTFEANKQNILIVAGAGGGSFYYTASYNNRGGHGGGIIGGTGTGINNGASTTASGGTQSGPGPIGATVATFGLGSNAVSNVSQGGGGGSGWYGGNTSQRATGGGSGYIGNLISGTRDMYTYCDSNCTTYQSSIDETKTTTGTCVNETATENCAKSGNGYARITYMSSS